MTNIIRHWLSHRTESMANKRYQTAWYTIRLLIILSLSCLTMAHARQQNQFPLDTSYTVSGTRAKLIKNYPFIKPVQPTSPDAVKKLPDVVYKTIDDSPFGKRSLRADVFIPRQNAAEFPALVLVHGGGWRAGNKTLNTPMAEQLALQGFVVVSVEYRLSLEAKYPAAVHDINTCIRWVRSQAREFNVDTSRIAIAGSSAGGQLASLIGATNGTSLFEGEDALKAFSSDVQAVIDLDGLLDFSHADNLAVKRTDYSADVFWLGGFHHDIPQRWREASPVTWVSKATPPFLFINSSQKRFHAGYLQMVDKLNAWGTYSKVITLDNAPHSYWLFHPWFEPTVQHMTNFLNKIFDTRGK